MVTLLAILIQYGLRIAALGLDQTPEIVANFAGESNPLYCPTRCPHKGGGRGLDARPDKINVDKA